MDQDQTRTGGKITAQLYVVALIDLLNQANQLGEWKSLPESPTHHAEFIAALGRTVGHVSVVREAFKGFLKNYTATDETNPAFARLTDDQKAEYRELLDVKLGCQHFSDTVILYSPLAISGADTTVHGVHGMLLAAASVLLTGLAGGLAIRGGIDIGMAADCFPGEIYGPVLPSVYHIEQHVAQYPRVVVGAEVTKYLEACVADRSRSAAHQWNGALACDCQSLIARDQDGALFVDFLGDEMRRDCSDEADYREQVKKGHAFAKREHQRFVKEGDHKLALRYAWLRQYYESSMRRHAT